MTADHFGSGENTDPILLQELVTTRYPERTEAKKVARGRCLHRVGCDEPVCAAPCCG